MFLLLVLCLFAGVEPVQIRRGTLTEATKEEETNDDAPAASTEFKGILNEEKKNTSKSSDQGSKKPTVSWETSEEKREGTNIPIADSFCFPDNFSVEIDHFRDSLFHASLDVVLWEWVPWRWLINKKALSARGVFLALHPTDI